MISTNHRKKTIMKIWKSSYFQLGIMIILTFLIKITSLIKTSVGASYFGAGIEMDAFNFTNNIGVFIFSFIGTGITTVLIPAMVNDDNKRSINNFITTLSLISMFILFIVYAVRIPILNLFSPDSEAFVHIGGNLMLITLLTQFENTIMGVTNSHFQTIKKFNIPKIILLISNSILAILLLLPTSLSIYQYASFILLTGAINLSAQYIIARNNGFEFKPIVDLKDPELANMLRIFVPTIISTGLYQITLLTDSLVATYLGQGQVSILTYSNTLMSMINMLLIGNLMAYIYPNITRNIKDKDGVKLLFEYSVLFNVIMFLVVIGFYVVGQEAITLLYERGEFDPALTRIVFYCSIIYVIGLPINVTRDLLYRYFYARGNTKETLKNSVYASIFNLIVSLILSIYIGIFGVILGTVLTSIVSLSSILVRFNKNYGAIPNINFVILETGKIIFSSILVIMLVLFIEYHFPLHSLIGHVTFYGAAVITLYLSFLIIFKSKVFKIKL